MSQAQTKKCIAIIMKMQKGNLEIGEERWVGKKRGTKRIKVCFVYGLVP